MEREPSLHKLDSAPSEPEHPGKPRKQKSIGIERRMQAPERRKRVRERIEKSMVGALTMFALAAGMHADTNKATELLSQLRYIDQFKPATDNYKYEIPTIEDILRGTDVERDLEFGSNQLVTQQNKRLKEGLGTHKTAVVVVHGGYADYTATLLSRDFNNDIKAVGEDQSYIKRYMDIVSGTLGDYYTHRDNLVRLTDELAKTDAPVIYAVEDKAARNPTLPYKELDPPQNAFVLITEDDDGTLKNMVRSTKNDYIKQQPELIYNALRKSGVTTVLMAGEYSFNSENKFGCLGSVAHQFQTQGFKVKGLRGGVFPTKEPYETIEGEETRKALYHTTVSIKNVSEELK